MPLYSSQFLDITGVFLFAVILALVAVSSADVWRVARKRRWRIFRRKFAVWGSIIAATMAIFLTYATVRLQTVLAADVSYDQIGVSFVQDEMENETFRCLYTWHAFDDPIACRERIFSSVDSYSKTMLYMEEVVFFLEEAKNDRRVWGNSYWEDIQYWADSVSVDHTGLFSYLIVVNAAPGSDPMEVVRAASLTISRKRLCANYRAVTEHLDRVGANPKRVDCKA